MEREWKCRKRKRKGDKRKTREKTKRIKGGKQMNLIGGAFESVISVLELVDPRPSNDTKYLTVGHNHATISGTLQNNPKSS